MSPPSLSLRLRQNNRPYGYRGLKIFTSLKLRFQDFQRKQFHYRALTKRQKGIIIRFLLQITGYSRQQLTRLIQQYLNTGVVQLSDTNKPAGFKQTYTTTDIALLAEMDERYDTPSGGVVKKLCERAYSIFDEVQYKNIANISVSHLYNLRGSTGYQNQRRHFEKTKSKKVAIGDRRKPNAAGKPDYIRVDTAHQGDQDGKKGVYHINAVDEVTQYEVVLSCRRLNDWTAFRNAFYFVSTYASATIPTKQRPYAFWGLPALAFALHGWLRMKS